MPSPIPIRKEISAPPEIVKVKTIIEKANKPKPPKVEKEDIVKTFLYHFFSFIHNPFDPIVLNVLEESKEKIKEKGITDEALEKIKEPEGIDEEFKRRFGEEAMKEGKKIAEKYFERKGWEKGGEEMIGKADEIGVALEDLSHVVEESKPEDLLYLARVIDEGEKGKIEKALKEIEDHQPELARIIRNLLEKDEEEVAFFISKSHPLDFEGIKELKVKGKKPLAILLRLYAKILSNEKFMKLLKSLLKGRWKRLAVFLSSLDLVMKYYFLKKILPLLYASGLVGEKGDEIINFLLKISIGGRMRSNVIFAELLPKLKKFLFFFGMPDGRAIMVFMRGMKWK